MSKIDVSKCPHYDSGECNCYYEEMNYEIFSKDSCIEHLDCHYRQLQQLKAENKELKKKLKYAEKEYYFLAEEYAEFGHFNFSEEEKQIKYPEIIKEE